VVFVDIVAFKINHLPMKDLLFLGKRFCLTDFAVRFYSNKQHPKFFKNREALVHAVRRAFAMGNKETKRKIKEFFEELPGDSLEKNE
jgi:hypothetical protein